jgi:hypothetical protein
MNSIVRSATVYLKDYAVLEIVEEQAELLSKVLA